MKRRWVVWGAVSVAGAIAACVGDEPSNGGGGVDSGGGDGTVSDGGAGDAASGDAANDAGAGTPLRMISAGLTGYTCAIGSNGGAYCWGNNGSGQLGNGTAPSNAHSPTPVTGLSSGVVSISAGNNHACAVQGGSVYCWGSNDYGDLGANQADAGPPTSPIPIQVPSLTGISAVAAGYDFTCALRTIGDVVCWGYGETGALGQTSPVFSSPTPISVVGLTNVKAISAGYQDACAVTNDGDVYCWGYGNHGQIGNNSTNSANVPVKILTGGATAIAGSYLHNCAIQSGKVLCWGLGTEGELGTMVEGGLNDSHVPVEATGLSAMATIAAGQFHTCATSSAGGAYCFGVNDQGELGNGMNTPSNNPAAVSVTGITAAASVAAGATHSCAFLFDGGAACWGENDAGQLGDTTVNPSLQPVSVQGLP